MPDNLTIPSVTAGWMTLEQFAADIGKGMRTVRRYVDRGMPVIRVGASPYVDPQAVRQWFAAGMPLPSASSPRMRRRA